eukprot:COSAG06_NODE_3693_length_4999_cov_204.219388_4_plen_70_part_00
MAARTRPRVGPRDAFLEMFDAREVGELVTQWYYDGTKKVRGKLVMSLLLSAQAATDSSGQCSRAQRSAA